MIAAETITDGNIWDLLHEATLTQDRVTAGTCITALGISPFRLRPGSIFPSGWTQRVHAARARCAEILNARAASKAGAK